MATSFEQQVAVYERSLNSTHGKKAISIVNLTQLLLTEWKNEGVLNLTPHPPDCGCVQTDLHHWPVTRDEVQRLHVLEEKRWQLAQEEKKKTVFSGSTEKTAEKRYQASNLLYQNLLLTSPEKKSKVQLVCEAPRSVNTLSLYPALSELGSPPPPPPPYASANVPITMAPFEATLSNLQCQDFVVSNPVEVTNNRGVELRGDTASSAHAKVVIDIPELDKQILEQQETLQRATTALAETTRTVQEVVQNQRRFAAAGNLIGTLILPMTSRQHAEMLEVLDVQPDPEVHIPSIASNESVSSSQSSLHELHTTLNNANGEHFSQLCDQIEQRLSFNDSTPIATIPGAMPRSPAAYCSAILDKMLQTDNSDLVARKMVMNEGAKVNVQAGLPNSWAEEQRCFEEDWEQNMHTERRLLREASDMARQCRVNPDLGNNIREALLGIQEKREKVRGEMTRILYKMEKKKEEMEENEKRRAAYERYHEGLDQMRVNRTRLGAVTRSQGLFPSTTPQQPESHAYFMQQNNSAGLGGSQNLYPAPEEEQIISGQYPVHFDHHIGRPVYKPWTLLDLEAYVCKLPSLSSGANVWITELNRLTAHEEVAVRDLRAILGRIKGTMWLTRFENTAGTMNVTDATLLAQVCTRFWDALRLEFPMQTDVALMRTLAMKPDENIHDYITRAQSHYFHTMCSHYDRDDTHVQIFRDMVLTGLPVRLYDTLADVAGLSVKPQAEWQAVVLHHYNRYIKEKNTQTESTAEMMQKIALLQLQELERQKKKVNKDKDTENQNAAFTSL